MGVLGAIRFGGEKNSVGQYIVVVQFVVKQKVTRFKMAMLLKFKGWDGASYTIHT